MSMSEAELAAIISNTSDLRNIYNGAGEDQWGTFIRGISLSIRNRSLSRYPIAQLNTDGSTSFFLHQCSEGGCADCAAPGAKAFERTFNVPYIVGQLEHQRERLKLPLTKGREQLVEMIDKDTATTGVVEYRINLSPENLDTILKLRHQYAYRAEASVLSLRNQITLKPGVICLFPVSPLGDKLHAMRVAGCQTAEIPAVQLLRLLPDFDGIEGHFHWEVPKVEEKLSVERTGVETILNEVLKAQGMVPEGTEWYYLQSLDGSQTVCDPASPDGDVKIVDMSPEARHIYLTYGNIGADEVDACKSVEISTVAYLKAIRALIIKYDYDDDNPDSIPLIDVMIRIEEEKISAAAVGAGMAAAGGAGMAAAGGAGVAAAGAATTAAGICKTARESLKTLRDEDKPDKGSDKKSVP